MERADATSDPVEASHLYDLADEKWGEIEQTNETMGLITRIIFDEMVANFKDAESYEKGYITGRVIFEVAAVIAPYAKAGKAVDAVVLTKISDLAKIEVVPGKLSAGWNRAWANIAVKIQGILTTKMCFVAGTLVMTAEGSMPIKDIRPGMEVWAKHEVTMEEGWRPVVQTFETHPEELFTLSIDTDGDGAADEELTGTGEHPFWVEDAGEFLPMLELSRGMRLFRAQDGGPAIVMGNVSKRGPPGERFTTYNFEVEDFHTYFVGESGIWVHNLGKSWCEKAFVEYKRHRDNFDEPWDAFSKMVESMPKKTPSTVFAWSALEVGRDIDNWQKRFPTHKEIKQLMTSRKVGYQLGEETIEGTQFAKSDPVPDWIQEEWGSNLRRYQIESHHGVPRKVQEWLGIDASRHDDSPALITTMMEHRGKGGESIHAVIARKFADKMRSNGHPNPPDSWQLNQGRPPGLSDAQLKDALREAYQETDLEYFWQQCEVFISHN